MAEDYQTRKDIDTLYSMVWDNESHQLKLTNNEDFEKLKSKLGFEFDPDKINFAMVDTTYWIMSNAKYNYIDARFVKLDNDYTSFAICLETTSTDNVFKFYYNPKTSDVSYDRTTYNYDDYIGHNYLGAFRKLNNEFVLFDIDVGWMTVEYVPKTDWETVSIEATGCNLIVNESLRLAQFKCYRENESFSDTNYKTIATIPSDYKPLSTVILPFLNKNMIGYVKYDTGVFNVSLNPSGTSTIQTSAIWHY